MSEKSGDALGDDTIGGDTLGDYALGGDPACWLSHVCPECGALVEGSTAVPCWRCGATRDDADD